MTKLLAAMVIFIFSFTLSACSDNSAGIFDKAEKLIQAEKYDDAIKTLADAVKQTKDKKIRSEMYLMQAQIYRKNLRQYDKALSLLDEADTLKTGNIQIPAEQAKNYIAKEDYEKAIAIYDQLIEKGAKNSDIYLQRAKLLIITGLDPEKAEKDLAEAIKIEPKSDKVYTSRGDLHMLNGNFKAAISDYDEALKLNPSAMNYLKRGECYYEMQQPDKAREDFKKAFQGRSTLDEGSQGIVKERLEILQ